MIRRASTARTIHCASLALVVLLPLVLSPTHAPADAPGHAQDDGQRDRMYLAELALLIEGARRLLSFSALHAEDAELSRFAYPLSERYVEMANRMLPSARLRVVHPHLLLVVENLERALDAAAAANTVLHQKRMRIAREELSNVDAVLKQLKLRLPELPR